MVSIIVPTYNRANTLLRAIQSILDQDYKDFEVIIVDDGSTDNTQEVLKAYNDKRIRIIRHEKNKGVCAAKNTGFDCIKGDWFTILDSDDEMVVPNALSTMLDVIENIDPEINAITCNCIDAVNGNFTGKGVYSDQYLQHDKIIKDLNGEHWGLTKTSLLNNDRLNESITGMEDILWYKINKRAKRFYIHKALRIYHTEGSNRVSNYIKNFDIKKRYNDVLAILSEKEYLWNIRNYDPNRYKRMLFNFIFICKEYGDKEKAKMLANELMGMSNSYFKSIIVNLTVRLSPRFINVSRFLKNKIKKNKLTKFVHGTFNII